MNEHASALGKLGAEARWGKKIQDDGTPDLFEQPWDDPLHGKYPAIPGFKRNGTSADAAEKMKSRAIPLRRRCLVCLKERASTADEVAERLGKSILSIRPRLSELVALDLLEETGRRRRNESGTMAAEWKVKDKDLDAWNVSLEMKIGTQQEEN